MVAKLPIISSPVTFADSANAARGLFEKNISEEFVRQLALYLSSKHVKLFNSGIAAYYVILKALKARYNKHEVIIPAYTAGCLVTALRKAGLRPVLCDISLADFNADANEMMNLISDRTLAVTCIHMFGIGMESIERVRESLPPATVLIEDCAQSMGSMINGRMAGSFGDVGFFSFNRGKNLPISGGGCISTNSDILWGIINNQSAVAPERSRPGLSDVIKSLAFTFASNPRVYGMFYSVVSRFKETMPPEDVYVGTPSNFQTALGAILMNKEEGIFAKRRDNGMKLISALKDIKGILLPVISSGNSPVFNRMPVVFEDAGMLTRAERLLWAKGIESSRMYIRPLHHMFDLGYCGSDFPHANYFVQRLLTLPVHQAVTDYHVEIIACAIKDALK
ncbi:MAG TPA: DegT/DnrJ/EryC1/StrS family aminotransferase [Candidatus Omnitrophota bacterium]|nr:DegT/DnrJ/EryC1/StrS family aminotransferase [Candidatus Omnitrophota bacterium]